MIGSMAWAKLVHRWPQHAGKFVFSAVLLWSSITLLTRELDVNLWCIEC